MSKKSNLKINFINPNLFLFVKHWNESERKKAAGLTYKHIVRYMFSVDQDDILQEILLTLLEEYRRKKHNLNIEHINLSIKSSLSSSYGSKKSKKKQFNDSLAKFSTIEDVDTFDIQAINEKSLIADIYMYIERTLSEKEYEIFYLYYIKEYTHSEICKKVKITDYGLRKVKKKIDKTLVSYKTWCLS